MTSDTEFTAEERAAMKERARELKAGARRKGRPDRAEVEAEVRAKIAEMAEADRLLADRIHSLVLEAAPELVPRLWYGMPAYAKDGKVVCFFRDAGKFKERYSMFGFNDAAALDEDGMWPTSYAVTTLSPEIEARIAELVRRAVG